MRSSSGANRSRRPHSGPPSNGRKPSASTGCDRGAADIIGKISRCIRRTWSRPELGGDGAVKHRRPDVIETAFEIGPDFTADIGPAFAEREIFAEIGSTLPIDQALEQREPVRASGQGVNRMRAEEL